MKTKFETNVAAELPKTRMSREPGLPWKLNPDDLEKTSGTKEEFKAAMTQAAPLKTRAIFPIMLLVTVFVAIIYLVSLIMTDSENTYTAAQEKEAAMSSIQTTLGKINDEKNVLSENIGQLEKRVSELNAQKELFATVIESLTKKADEQVADSAGTEQASQNAQ